MDEDTDRRTLWCGNLSPKITDELLFELFLQAGPVEKVSIPKDKDGRLRNFGFITFKHESSVRYAIEVMDGSSLFGRNLAMKNRKITEQQQQQRNYQPASYYQGTPYSGGMQHDHLQRNNLEQQAQAQAMILLLQQQQQQNISVFDPSVLALQGYQQQVYGNQNNSSMQPQQRNNGRRPTYNDNQSDHYQQHGRQYDRSDRDRPRQHERSNSHHGRNDRSSRHNDKPYSRRQSRR